MSTPPGWYPDQSPIGHERYWDGNQWTQQVRPVASAAIQPRSSGFSALANIVWLLLAGVWLALGYVAAGIVNCMTIIGIPFGIQAFKLAGYALWPFGRVVVQRPNRDAGLSRLGNVIWFVLSGLWLALAHLFAGVLLCLTIIGIPLGVASFKMAGLAIAPFGKMVVPKSQLSSMPGAVVVSSVG